MRKSLFKVYFLTSLAMLSIASLSIFGILKVKEYHIAKIESEVSLDVSQVFNAVKQRIKGSLNALKQTELFFRHSDEITRDEFHLYAKGVLNLYPEIKALEWLPIITHDQKQHYEHSVQNEGYPNFFISEKDPVKGIVPVRKKEFYTPVHFIEPMKGNEIAFGLDSSSNLEGKKAIERALSTGQMSMTAPTILVQGDVKQKAILIYQPHYFSEQIGSKKIIKGLVLLIIKMDEFHKNMGPHFSQHDSAVSRLADVTDDFRLVAGSEVKFKEEDKWHIVLKEWDVAGRKWSFQVNHDVRAEQSYQFGKVWSWAIAIVAFFMTVMMTYLIYSKLRFKEQQTKAELAFLNEEERYKKLLNSSADAYFLQDMEGNLLDINKVACDVMGYTREELLKLTVFDINEIIEGSTREDYIQYFKHFPKGKGVVRELNYRKKNGEHFPVEISLNKFTYNDTDVLSGFIRDISERKQYENSLKQATKKAQKANQAKSDFLAKMSHEFRTPMHSILSFSEMGLKRINNVPIEKLEGYFANIQTSGRRLMKLLNSLLDLAKLETGKLKFSFEKSSLFAILKKCLNEQELQLKEKTVVVNVIKSDSSGRVICDEDKIYQVITNLLSNAIKFTSKSSSLSIEIKENFDILSVPGVVFSISDEGHGIPENELNSIFDKFVQSSKVSETHQGTGLGLAICNEIIEGHSGRIWADNIKGGACLSFVIPLSPFSNFAINDEPENKDTK